MALLQREVKKIIVFVNSGTALKKDGESITIDSDIAKERYTTKPNDWFGIPEYEVEVLWVYNAPVQDWIHQLNPEVQSIIHKGIEGEQPLKGFPNYKTIGENLLKLIQLNPEQVSLLADMFSWSIQENRTVFEQFLAPVQ